LHWSLYGVPGQLECEATQEAYWEIQKFLVLALKASPNVLECHYSPLVEKATPLAEELIGMREIFLSRLEAELENAFKQSHLPEHSRGVAALDDLLVRVRLRKSAWA
jgi:predicted nucleotidyltransferase